MYVIIDYLVLKIQRRKTIVKKKYIYSLDELELNK